MAGFYVNNRFDDISKKLKDSGGASLISDLTDVVVTSPSLGDILGYKEGEWQNTNILTEPYTPVIWSINGGTFTQSGSGEIRIMGDMATINFKIVWTGRVAGNVGQGDPVFIPLDVPHASSIPTSFTIGKVEGLVSGLVSVQNFLFARGDASGIKLYSSNGTDPEARYNWDNFDDAGEINISGTYRIAFD